VKLNKSGKGMPLIVQLSLLSSSKKGCNKASKGLIRSLGLYNKIFETKSIASGSIFGLKT
jgi:hypothetical protein